MANGGDRMGKTPGCSRSPGAGGMVWEEAEEDLASLCPEAPMAAVLWVGHRAAFRALVALRRGKGLVCAMSRPTAAAYV